MWTRLRHAWDTLITGYWFVPAVMSAGAGILAVALLQVDRRLIGSDNDIGWLYVGGSDGARLLLSTVAGSVITVAGVVFSITIVALTQASSQFGPRLLRNFMSDTANQVVLGTFVATFLYCLLVLRTIHGGSDDADGFVPQASVTAAVLLAIACLAVLIYFIHHVSIELQAPSVIAAVRRELSRTSSRLEEETPGTGSPESADTMLPPGFFESSRVVAARSHGYLQAIDHPGLLEAAEEADLLLRLEHRAGAYLIRQIPVLRAWPADRCDDELCRRLASCFIIGPRASPEQDIEFSVRQLVEVAVRALSTGVNDPFTAINCIDALGSGLCDIARCGLPGPLRYGRDGRVLRIVAKPTTFRGLVEAAFNQIRQNASGNVAVMIRMLEVIGICAGQMETSEQRRALREQAEATYRQGQETVSEKRDLDDLRARWEAVQKATQH